MYGIWCGRRCCTLLLYPSLYRGSRFRIMYLNCGARGTRTPGPLLANRRQHIHSSAHVQVSVSGCAQRSSGILAGCCTFLLYPPAGSQRSRDFAVPLGVVTGDPRTCHEFDLTLLHIARFDAVSSVGLLLRTAMTSADLECKGSENAPISRYETPLGLCNRLIYAWIGMLAHALSILVAIAV